jgi:hypothetical protein
LTSIDTPLTTREKQIFSHCRTVAFSTAKSVSEEIGISYHSSLRYLNALAAKGYLASRKNGTTWEFYLPKIATSSSSLSIPFKGNHYSLEELLLYLSDTDDFQKYGKVISGSCYHLAYRVAQIQAGETPDSPGPKEVAQFLNSAKVRYQELLSLVTLLQSLPIFDDNETTIAAFGAINERYLHEQVFDVFQPTWAKGAISPVGLKDKFRETISRLKNQFSEKYGPSRKVSPK